MIDLRIDALQLNVLLSEIGATDEQVRKALRSTVGKMSNWLRTRAGRAIRKETGLKMDHLRRRLKAIKLKNAPNGAAGGLWIGLNAVDLKYLKPEQDGLGVSAGPPGRSRSYEGAFMGGKPGKVARKLNGRVFVRKGRERMPIKKVGLDIEDDANRALDTEVMEWAKFEAQFFKVLEHELRWRTR